MNLDDDYDNDGNNIVPCPICLDVHCPSKEDGKCPEEDAFVHGHTLAKIFEEKLTKEEIKSATEAIAFMINESYETAMTDAVKIVEEKCPDRYDTSDPTDPPTLHLNQTLRFIIGELNKKKNENRNQNTEHA